MDVSDFRVPRYGSVLDIRLEVLSVWPMIHLESHQTLIYDRLVLPLLLLLNTTLRTVLCV